MILELCHDHLVPLLLDPVHGEAEHQGWEKVDPPHGGQETEKEMGIVMTNICSSKCASSDLFPSTSPHLLIAR